MSTVNTKMTAIADEIRTLSGTTDAMGLDASPSLFAKVLIPDVNIIPEWEQPDSTNPYMTGDKVSHNDKIWISIVDNNVWEPGVYGWEETAE